MKVSIFTLLDCPTVVVQPTATDSAGPTDPELPAETIIELWRERAAIMESENPDSDTNVEPIPDDADWPTRQQYELKVRRFWEICASAEMSLTYGDYAGWIIRPHLSPVKSMKSHYQDYY